MVAVNPPQLQVAGGRRDRAALAQIRRTPWGSQELLAFYCLGILV